MDAQQRVQQLTKRLRAVADRSVKAAFLRDALVRMEVSEVAETLALAVFGAEAGDGEHADLLQYLSLAMADERADELRDRTRQHLLDRDLGQLAALLQRGDAEDSDEAMRLPDFGVGRPLSLGERKSLARRLDRNLIARVLRDPHQDVIRILLDNPGLTEPDVVRLAARRPVPSDVLREVFRHVKWIVRYPVKVALALNPHTPMDIRLQVVPHLARQDVARLLDGPGLHPTLAAACSRVGGQSSVH